MVKKSVDVNEKKKDVKKLVNKKLTRSIKGDKSSLSIKKPKAQSIENSKGIDSSLLGKEHVSVLKKQQYYFSGNHSAVKICTWTKRSLRGEDVCYKEQFYGIRSHLCCQMSLSVSFCQNQCIFCWRDLAHTKGTEMDSIPNEMLDDPKDIIDNSIIGQRKLLEGYGGYKDTDQKKFKASVDPMHFAISLTGEGTLYPKLAEFIKLLHKQKKTTFLVTNGLHTDALKRLEDEDALPTQLYVSLDAPDEKLFKKIDCPQVKDAWKSLMKTMDFLKEVNDKTRTAIRITAIKNMNMENEEGYAEIINRADPLFIEVKSYMWVGSSQKRLDIKNMPLHGETREFAERIGKLCGYKIIDEKTNSRVILLAKSDFPGRIMKF